MGTLRLSLAQYAAGLDVETNTATAVGLIERAAPGADLIVLPENAMYSDPARVGPEGGHSEPLDGGFVTALRGAASDAGTAVLVGTTETSGAPDDGRPFNTLVHISAEGEIAGTYRKIHLYDAFGYRESDRVCPAPIGDPLVFSLNGVTVGAATCYDLRFPEMTRWLVEHGAEAVLLPAAWAAGPAKELHWETLIRARAIENTVYFAGCGQTGPHCTAQSIIADPMGAIIASAGEAAGAITSAIIDTTRIAQVRKANPSLANRRFAVSPR